MSSFPLTKSIIFQDGLKNTMQMMIINGFSLWIYLFTDSHLNIPTWQRWKIFVRGGFWPIAISLSISFNEILYIRYKAKRRQTRMDWPSEIVLACISARWFGTMEFYDFPSSWEYFSQLTKTPSFFKGLYRSTTNHQHSYGKWPVIVDLPTKHGDFP